MRNITAETAIDAPAPTVTIIKPGNTTGMKYVTKTINTKTAPMSSMKSPPLSIINYVEPDHPSRCSFGTPVFSSAPVARIGAEVLRSNR